MDIDPRTEDQLQLLCDARNSTICEIVNETGEVHYVEELADRLVARDVTVVSSIFYDDEFDKACFELHHERLPKLAEADLIEYDPEANRAKAKSSPPSNVDWQDESSFEPFLFYPSDNDVESHHISR